MYPYRSSSPIPLRGLTSCRPMILSTFPSKDTQKLVMIQLSALSIGMVQAALPSPCTLRRPPVCTRLVWVSAQSCPGSHIHPLLRRWPWRRATPRACGRSCRASRSGERGSRTWQQLDWFDSEVRSLVRLSSLVPEGVSEDESETCVTTVSFSPLGRRCVLPSKSWSKTHQGQYRDQG